MQRAVFNIDPYSFTTSAFIIGLILAKELSIEEQDSIGNWLQLIGLTMQTYASQNVTLAVNRDSTSNDSKDKNSSDIETLKETIKRMEEELDKLYKK